VYKNTEKYFGRQTIHIKEWDNMKILNRELFVLDFIPPVLVRPLMKIKSYIGGTQNKNENLPLHSFISTALRSYSQFNEDLLIDLLFGFKKNGFYIDIGANDPTFNNNMKRFYDTGWSGINIEPELNSIKKFFESRTRDINLNIGVGPVRGTLTFYQVVGDSTLSSFNVKIAKKMAARFGLTIEEIAIDVFRLIDIFEQYVKDRQVDFMSVDAEGLDLEILQSNDWNRFRPSVIMVEIDNQYNQILEFMNQCNYMLVFNNYHNGIFIDKATSEKNLKDIVGNA
jgi:FkbM family methyltransferase